MEFERHLGDMFVQEPPPEERRRKRSPWILILVISLLTIVALPLFMYAFTSFGRVRELRVTSQERCEALPSVIKQLAIHPGATVNWGNRFGGMLAPPVCQIILENGAIVAMIPLRRE